MTGATHTSHQHTAGSRDLAAPPLQARLLHADCLDAMPTLPDNSVDLILADLPYGTTQCAWDAIIPFQPLWREYLRIAKPQAAIVLCAAQPFTAMVVASNPSLFRYEWIWEKGNATGFLNAKKEPLRAHESAQVFYRRQPVYNPQKTSGHPRKTSKRSKVGSDCYGEARKTVVYDSTERYPRSVQFFSSDKQKSKLHPTQKPVAWMEFLIRTYTDPGAIVLDNCMGSGTTGVAAIGTGRGFIGIEKDPKYFEVARQRMTAQPTTAISSNPRNTPTSPDKSEAR